MKTLHLSIKKPYFDAIRRGAKTTEYRTMSDYWMRKIVDLSEYKGKTLDEIREGLVMGKLKLHYIPYDTLIFHCQNLTYEIGMKKVEVYRGHETFAIKLSEAYTS